MANGSKLLFEDTDAAREIKKDIMCMSQRPDMCTHRCPCTPAPSAVPLVAGLALAFHMACGHGPDICPHRDVAGELVEYQQKGVTLERHDIRAMAEAKAKARAEADATAKEEAEASSKETPALCANQEKLQLTYDAIVQVDGGKELLGKAMSMAHKNGMTVDEKTLGMIFDEFDVDTVRLTRCRALGHPAHVCIRRSACRWAVVPFVTRVL